MIGPLAGETVGGCARYSCSYVVGVEFGHWRNRATTTEGKCEAQEERGPLLSPS